MLEKNALTTKGTKNTKKKKFSGGKFTAKNEAEGIHPATQLLLTFYLRVLRALRGSCFLEITPNESIIDV